MRLHWRVGTVPPWLTRIGDYLLRPDVSLSSSWRAGSQNHGCTMYIQMPRICAQDSAKAFILFPRRQIVQSTVPSLLPDGGTLGL